MKICEKVDIECILGMKIKMENINTKIRLAPNISVLKEMVSARMYL